MYQKLWTTKCQREVRQHSKINVTHLCRSSYYSYKLCVVRSQCVYLRKETTILTTTKSKCSMKRTPYADWMEFIHTKNFTFECMLELRTADFIDSNFLSFTFAAQRFTVQCSLFVQSFSFHHFNNLPLVAGVPCCGVIRCHQINVSINSEPKRVDHSKNKTWKQSINIYMRRMCFGVFVKMCWFVCDVMSGYAPSRHTHTHFTWKYRKI